MNFLSTLPLGTLFTYPAARQHCLDGQAVLVEYQGRRVLIDTYWGRTSAGIDDHFLTDEEQAAATISFRPDHHREVTAWQAEVHGDATVQITWQHGCYRQFYVPTDTPELTELDYARHQLATDEAGLAAAEAAVERRRASVERGRRRVATLEDAAVLA